MPARPHQERYHWDCPHVSGVICRFTLLASDRDLEWDEPHLVKILPRQKPVIGAPHPATLADVESVSTVPLSLIVSALLTIAREHKHAEALRQSDREAWRWSPVTSDEVLSWCVKTESLAARLDLTPETRASMKRLASQLRAADEWPAAFFATKPRNSAERRILRLSIVLWTLEHLRRAAADLEPNALDEARWSDYRRELYDLFEDLPQSSETTRPTFERSLAERFARLERRIRPKRSNQLMAWMLESAIGQVQKHDRPAVVNL